MAQLRIDFFSQCLMRMVTVSAVLPVDKFLPPGAPAPTPTPFKTLYLLHGLMGGHTDWLTHTRIQAWAEERDLAVVMPGGDNHFYVDNVPGHQLYGEFIGRELVAVTRAMFPLSHSRADTFLAGLSMGGYGALRNGLKYADTFGCVAGLSAALVLDNAQRFTDDTPTIVGRRSFMQSVFGDLERVPGSDNDVRALLAGLKARGAALPALFLCCGTEDFLLDANRAFHRFLRENEAPHTYMEGPGGHNWDYWDAHILKVLDWLPLRR